MPFATVIAKTNLLPSSNPMPNESWEERVKNGLLEMEIISSSPSNESKASVMRASWEVLAPKVISRLIPHIAAIRKEAVEEALDSVEVEECPDIGTGLWSGGFNAANAKWRAQIAEVKSKMGIE